MNRYTDACRPVYLLQPDGKPPILEPEYQGYGVFGGVNAYTWLAVNNLSKDECDGLTKAMLFQAGIALESGKYYVDEVTGFSWGCSLHINPLQLNIKLFEHFNFTVIGNLTPNELIQSGRWVRHPLTDFLGPITCPLKFSFDQLADYDTLPASENCPQQGYFPSEILEEAKIYTLLHAEDGYYKKAHADREAAMKHVHFQMGENPESGTFGFYDQWGRTMCIVDTTKACAETLILLDRAMEESNHSD